MWDFMTELELSILRHSAVRKMKLLELLGFSEERGVCDGGLHRLQGPWNSICTKRRRDVGRRFWVVVLRFCWKSSQSEILLRAYPWSRRIAMSQSQRLREENMRKRMEENPLRRTGRWGNRGRDGVSAGSSSRTHSNRIVSSVGVAQGVRGPSSQGRAPSAATAVPTHHPTTPLTEGGVQRAQAAQVPPRNQTSTPMAALRTGGQQEAAHVASALTARERMELERLRADHKRLKADHARVCRSLLLETEKNKEPYRFCKMEEVKGRQQTLYEMRMGELITRKSIVGINRVNQVSARELHGTGHDKNQPLWRFCFKHTQVAGPGRSANSAPTTLLHPSYLHIRHWNWQSLSYHISSPAYSPASVRITTLKNVRNCIKDHIIYGQVPRERVDQELAIPWHRVPKLNDREQAHGLNQPKCVLKPFRAATSKYMRPARLTGCASGGESLQETWSCCSSRYA